MSRWIDADALQDKAYKMNFDQRITERELAMVNYLIGTIEKNHVIDIVRCKECKHWWRTTGANYGDCNHFWLDTLADAYCSYGERRE